jgi:hypothetical protein
MDDMTPLGPTRHYVIVCHDGRRIDVDAASEVRQVEREDGPIWSTT